MTTIMDQAAALPSQLDALFAPWNRSDCPGLVVGVQRGGRPVYRRAFGMASLETACANTITTRMRIGSSSKHFLGLLVLLLQERGLLQLDNPIGLYLPELTGVNALPTLRQLLQHRGGTRCHLDLGFIGHGMLAAPEGCGLRTLLRQTGANFPPGEAMIYNNGGYHLVSLAASRVTGQPLDVLFKSHLFDPLGMSSTTLAPSDHVMTPGMASMHLPPLVDGQWRRGLFPSLEVLGEGGIVSTVDDMLTWATHLRSRNAFGAPESWAQLLQSHADGDGVSGRYGLGLMTITYRGMAIWRHPGGVVGGASEFISAVDGDLDIIILSNGAPGASPTALADRVMDIVLADRLDPPAPRPLLEDFAAWLGDYVSADTGFLYSLEPQDGALCLRIAKYATPVALILDADGSLVTGLSGIGTIRLRCEWADGQPSISLRFGGREERFHRLPAPAADETPDWAALAGRYESEESGLSATIQPQGDAAIVQFRDAWGVSDFELTAIGRSWLHMRPSSDPAAFGAVLWFPHGWSSGFVLHSARTRHLPFARAGKAGPE
ncbi:CubicO group peptidase (beta-lactamase class C family) [Nitrospirillum viridazoti]|nr:CubicO group peptidase (beta-lactamase class C family) [Nitrospirillum amazonense]